MSFDCYAQRSLQEYLKDAASGRPTPGGGSVAALVGALAASMASMVANFTVGRKKFEDVQPEVEALLKDIESRMAHLLQLVDQDVKDFSQVSAVYGLPKGTEDEKKARKEALIEACRLALQTPLRVALEAAEVARIANRLSLIGNQSLITDVGVSGVLCSAAAEAAGLNVEVNLGQIPDDAFSAQIRSQLKGALDVARQMRIETWQRVLRSIQSDEGSPLF